MSSKTVKQTAIKPLDDRIVVEAVEAEAKTKGGIVLPEAAKEKPQEGKVVAVGPGRLNKDGVRIACDLKKGDRVVYGKYSGTDVKVGDAEYKIMRESEVLAKFD
jgi:chaperonin GroES